MTNIILFIISACLSFVLIYIFLQVFLGSALVYMESRLEICKHTKVPHKPTIFELTVGFIAEYILTVLKYPYKLFNLIPVNKAAKKADKVYVLMHGFSRNDKDLISLKHNMQNKLGNSAIVTTINQSYDSHNLDSAADALASKVLKIKEYTGATEVVLVGHSLGGVLCSYTVETHPEVKKLVRHVTAIGSPLHGTRLSVFAIGDCIKAIYPDTREMSELHHMIRTSDVKYHFVASCCDTIIFPWDSAIIPGDFDVHIVKKKGHLFMLHDKDVANKVIEWSE